VAKSGPPANQDTPQPLSLPVYGNYCGVGHGDPTGNTPPIDAVDAVCREHDLCYARLGAFDSRCDRAFVESMPSAIANTPSQAGKNAGLLALLYFSLAERNLALGETLFKKA
jgi:Phospholipase A2